MAGQRDQEGYGRCLMAVWPQAVWRGNGREKEGTCVALESGACMSIHPSRSCVHNRSRKAAPDAPKHEAGAHGQVERAGVFQVREWEGRGGGGGRRLKGAW